jgi:hypothetical protein
LLALGAALLGAWLLWTQTQIAQRQEAERRQRRFVALRATLPHILSQIVSYLELAMDWMIAAHPQIREHVPLSDPQHFPPNAIDSLQKMIEATSVDAVSQACADLLSDLQTFESRLQSVARSSRRQHRIQAGLDMNLEDYMLQAAQLHYKIGLLWPFARGRADDLVEHVEHTSIFGSLTQLGCDEIAFRRVFERANELDARREDAGAANSQSEPPPAAVT